MALDQCLVGSNNDISETDTEIRSDAVLSSRKQNQKRRTLSIEVITYTCFSHFPRH